MYIVKRVAPKRVSPITVEDTTKLKVIHTLFDPASYSHILGYDVDKDTIIYSKFKHNYPRPPNAKNSIVLNLQNTLYHSVPKYAVKEAWLDYFDTCQSATHTYFLRPGLKSFLQFVFAHCQVGIFCEETDETIQFVVQNIILPLAVSDKCPQPFVHFMYGKKQNKQCTEDATTKRDLHWVSKQYPLFYTYKTYIVDFDQDVKITNANWCLDVKPFHADNNNITDMLTTSMNDTNLQHLERWLQGLVEKF